ncbi:MAG: hypothetical protein ACRDRW_07840 [Pseudonocardiaceae bacterium]
MSSNRPEAACGAAALLILTDADAPDLAALVARRDGVLTHLTALALVIRARLLERDSAAVANLTGMESLITGTRARGHHPLFHDEIVESFQAWRRAQPGLGEELVDVARYLFALAEMNRHTPR